MRRMRTPQAECVGNVTVVSYQPCSEKVHPETESWQGTLHSRRAMIPGLAISYAVLAFNLFGDGLRDILDPRLVER